MGAAGARNAGARVASGEVLLFLDDDLVPATDLVTRHLERQAAAGPQSVVVGYSPPRPVRPTLAAQAAAIWWEDHFRAKREMAAPTFVDMLSGNMSVRRELFERIGEFDERFGRFRREDWDWGIRALNAGVSLLYDATAVAHHHFDLDTRGRIAAARGEGMGDALLVERYPVARASLAFSWNPPPRRIRGRLAYALLADERVREAGVRVLDVLERLKARTTWARWFAIAQRAAYKQGLREGGGRARADGPVAPLALVELESCEPLPHPEVVAPVLRPTVAGSPAGEDLLPGQGQWTPALADQLTARVREADLARAESLRRTPAAPPPRGLRDVTVLFGPDAPAADARCAPRLVEAGAEVRVLTGLRHWEELDRGIRECRRPLVALTMPGVAPTPAWLYEALVGLEGERVAAVTGAGLEAPGRGHPLLLFADGDFAEPYPAIGLPSQYLVARRDAYLALGGFDLGTAPLGAQAPLIDLLERARAAGWIIGHRNTPGLSPPLERRPARRWAEWRRWQARGALIGRDSGTRGMRWLFQCGVAPAIARLVGAARPRRSGRRHGLGTAVAMALGLARGVRRG